MEADQRILLWISLSILSIFLFLLLPIEVYDIAPFAILLAGGALTGVLVAQVIKSITGEYRWMAGVTMAMVVLLLVYSKSYNWRRSSLLDSRSMITDGLITDRSMRYRKSKGYYTLHYSYDTRDGVRYGEQDVSFDVYMNFEMSPKILVDYVPDRPSISRINNVSLVPDVNAHEKFMQWQKENRSK